MESKNEMLKNRNRRGQLTVNIAHKLSQNLKERGYDVLYDHGDSSEAGEIVSWYGKGDKPGRKTELSQLDIAIVRRVSDKAIALIEIEETDDRPKTLMGDVFCTLLGDQINYHGKPLNVGIWTTLFIVGFSKAIDKDRNCYFLEKIERIKSDLDTNNSTIGKVVIKAFSEEKELYKLLMSILDDAFKGDL